MIENICEANRADAKNLTDIAMKSKAHWGYSSDFMAACESELAVTEEKICAERFKYRVYKVDGNICGFYAIEQLSEDEIELEALFVLPSKIGMGIGTSLFNHAVKLANSLGVSSIKIISDPNAEAFYARCGAELVGNCASGSIADRFLPVYRYTL